MKRVIACLLAFGLLDAGSSMRAPASTSGPCGRSCLEGVIDSYLAAAHLPPGWD